MPKTPQFYSVNEVKKAPAKRVHHDNRACRPGQDIRPNERKPGMGGYQLCDNCKKLYKKL